MITGNTIALTRWTFVGKVMSLLFNMLSRLVITFLPRSKRLLISWLQSPSAVILEPPQIKSTTVSPSICHEVMRLDAMILIFWMLSFKPNFSLSSFTFIKSLQWYVFTIKSIIQNSFFHCPKIHYVPPPPPSLVPHQTPDLFTVSIVLPFLQCHIVGIQYVVFLDQLLSFSSMHLSFYHVLIAHFFLSLSNSPLYGRKNGTY